MTMLSKAWIDDVKIHDVDDLLHEFALRSEKGLGGSPAPKAARTDRPRAHGAVDRSRWYQPRTIVLAGYVNDGSAAATQAALDVLRGAVALGSAHVLKFRRLGFPEDERLTVVIDGELDAPTEGYEETVRWAMTLVAPDPRIYADAVKSASYDPTAAGAGAGIDFPIDFPIVFGSGAAATLTVTNQGTVETPPIFTVTGPGNLTAIDEEITGQSIYFTGLVIAAGDQVVVDVTRRRTTVNGVLRPDVIDGRLTRWFDLPKAQSRLRLRGSQFAAGQTSLAVSYRDARV